MAYIIVSFFFGGEGKEEPCSSLRRSVVAWVPLYANLGLLCGLRFRRAAGDLA